MNKRTKKVFSLLESSKTNTSVLKSYPSKSIKSNTVMNNLTEDLVVQLPTNPSSHVQRKSIIKKFILPVQKKCLRDVTLVSSDKTSLTNKPIVCLNSSTSSQKRFCKTGEQNRSNTTTNILNIVQNTTPVTICNLSKTIVKDKDFSSNLAINISVNKEENRNTLSREKSLNQTLDKVKIVSPKSNDLPVINLESDIDCIQPLNHETIHFVSNSNPEVSNQPEVVEKHKLLGFATHDSEGKLIYTDLTNVHNNNTTRIKENPKIETSKVMVPDAKKKQITIIFPSQFRKKSRLKKTELNLLQPVSEMLNADLPKLVPIRPDQALNQKPMALDLLKSQLHTVEKQTTNLQGQMQQTEHTEPRVLQKTFSCPVEQLRSNITSMPVISATRVIDKQVHKPLGNGSLPSKVNKPIVMYLSPTKSTTLSSVDIQNQICPNVKTTTNKNHALLNQTNLEKNVPQYTNCLTTMTEQDSVNINSNNKSEINQIITPTVDESSSECNQDKNNLNYFSNVNKDDKINFIGRNTQIMWNTNKNNLTEEYMEKIVVLSALKDFKVCRIPEDEDGNIPLLKAVLENNKNTFIRQCIILKTLGQEHLNYQNKRLETALLLAVKSKHDDFVANLLNHGADLSIVDKHGNTALHISASSGGLVCTKLLLAEDKARDIINAYNDEGFSPIHLAAMGGHSEIVRALICEGADINKKDAKSGRTAYHHAIHFKKQDVVKVLEGLGCLTNEPDFAGHLPLLEELLIVEQPHITQVKNSLSTKNNRNETSTLQQIDQVHSPRKRTGIVSPDYIDKNETITVSKKKRKRNSKISNNEILTLSSEDSSDNDCMVVTTDYRNSSRNKRNVHISNFSSSFVPSRKRRRRKICIGDDDNSDCEVIDNPIPILHSLTSNVHFRNSNKSLGNSNIRPTMPILHAHNSDRTVAQSLDSGTRVVAYSKDNNCYQSFDSVNSVEHSQSESDEEGFKGFIDGDNLPNLQLSKMEELIRKIIQNSKLF